MSGPWPVTLLRLLLPLLFIRVCCDSNCLLSESGGMEVLARLKTLSPVQQRRAAALLGAIVADAAVMPLHWIYDQAKVQGLVEAGTAEFSQTSHCPFYTLETGQQSAYGDQLKVALKSVAEKKGFDASDLSEQLLAFFGPGTEYERGRQLKDGGQYPIAAPWTNGNVRTRLETGKAHSTSQDPDGLVRAVAVVAACYNKPDLCEHIRDCVVVTQSNPLTAAFAVGGGRILQHIIETGEDGIQYALTQLKDPKRSCKSDADADVTAAIEKGLASKEKPHTEATKEFGLPCGMPASFHGMIHGVATAKDYRSAVRASLLAGGDNCSRLNFIAACTAARYGLDGIPEEWVMKVKGYEQILRYIEIVAQL